MKAIKQKQDIEANQLYAELEQTKKQLTLIQSQNEAYLRRITSDEFQNPAAHLPKALADKLKTEEQTELVKKAYELAEQSKMLKTAIDKGDDINSEEMMKQITNSITKQDEMNELLKDVKRTYDNSIYEYEHLQEV